MHKLCLNRLSPGRLPSRLGTVFGGLDDLLHAAAVASAGPSRVRRSISVLPDLPDHLRRDLGL